MRIDPLAYQLPSDEQRRFYTVPVDCAEELGKAIIAAARGEKYGQPPGWRFDFLKQYEAGEWRRTPKEEDTEGDRADLFVTAGGARPAGSRRPRPPRRPSSPEW